MQTTTLWEEVAADERFRNLPCKVETNEQGQIILSRHKLRHALLKGLLVTLLHDHLSGGHIAIEFAIETPKGVKTADVVWISDDRLSEFPLDAAASPVAPELTIKVVSECCRTRKMREPDAQNEGKDIIAPRGFANIESFSYERDTLPFPVYVCARSAGSSLSWVSVYPEISH